MNQDDPTLPPEIADDSDSSNDGLEPTLAGSTDGNDSFVVSELEIDRTEMTISQFLSKKGLSGGVELDDSESSASDSLRDRQGRKYDLGKMIARGGMGAVLDAKDHCIRRHVAMKVMLKNQQSPESVLRFIEEAQVTGQLEHPAIVPVHELGVDTSGTVFYTMKYVQGRTLKDVLKAIRDGDSDAILAFPLVRLLNIFLRVCDAMAFAHSRKVIHRDLKPENIMLGEYGEVLVVDWGLAKVMTDSDSNHETESEEQPVWIVQSDRTDDNTDTARTMDGQVMGTPAFMPPEQASGRSSEIDERSDVYSLGAVLYNILTLHKPVHGKNLGEILTNVVDGNITDPTQFGRTRKSDVPSLDLDLAVELHHCQGRRVPESLAAVAMKALATQRETRYESVQRLQQEVQSYLDGFATLAENASLFRQCVLLFNRNKKEAAVLTGAFLLLVAITGGFMFSLNQKKSEAQIAERLAEVARGEAETARDDASTARDEAIVSAKKATVAEAAAIREAENALQSLKVAEQNGYFSDMLLVSQSWNEANTSRLVEKLDRYRDREDLRGFEWRYWNRLRTADLDWPVEAHQQVDTMAFNHDGSRLATGGQDKTIKIWDVATRTISHTLKGHSSRIIGLAFHPDRNTLVSSCNQRDVRVWDTDTGVQLRAFLGHKSGVPALSFSPDGSTVASGSWSGEIHVWDPETGVVLNTFQPVPAGIRDLSFRPDGQMLAIACNDATATIWNLTTLERVTTLRGHVQNLFSVAYSLNGQSVLTTGIDSSVRLWDASTGKLRLLLNAHSDAARDAIFTSDGQQIVSVSEDRTVRFWDAQTGKELRSFNGHIAKVTCLALSPDDTLLITGGDQIKAWNPNELQSSKILLNNNPGRILGLAFSPDAKTLVATGADSTIQMCQVDSGEATLNFLSHDLAANDVAFHPNGELVFTAYGEYFTNKNRKFDDGVVTLSNCKTGETLQKFRGHTDGINALSLSKDGRLLVTASSDETAKVWDTNTGENLVTFDGHTGVLLDVAISPDGSWVASVGVDGMIKIWGSSSGEEIAQHLQRDGWIGSVAISPDGSLLATGSYSGKIVLFDRKQDVVIGTLSGHSSRVLSLAFSPDGKRLASASFGKRVKLWDMNTRQETLNFKNDDNCYEVCFSPDGNQLAAAIGNTVKVWDARPWMDRHAVEARARGYLSVHREQAKTLEQLENYIQNDKTINDTIRQQCLDWAELFWENRESK